MADTVNEEILDRSILHAIFLHRLQNKEAAAILAFLESELLPDLVLQISNAASSAEAARLSRIERSIKAIIDRAFEKTEDLVAKRLSKVASREAKAQVAMLKQTVPVKIDWEFPTPERLKSIIKTPIRGRLLKEQLRDLNANTKKRVITEFRLGMIEGSSVGDMVRRIRGTKQAGYADGVWNTTRREVSSFVRTAANHIGSKAREELYVKNSDVIAHVLWVSTLDARTTEVCASMDGKTFKVGEGVRPPLHYNCRSIVIPIVKSWKELGIDLEQAPKGTRAAKQYSSLEKALNGSVPATTTYGEWLRNQPVEVQNRVLGREKAEIFRRGKLNLQNFTDNQGKLRSVAQLRKLEKAG